MKHRSHLRGEERSARSQAARIIHQEDFLLGSLIDSTFKCCKSNCWCRNARKGHPACYLSMRVGKKRKMIYIPKAKEGTVRELVANYNRIWARLTMISSYCLKRLKGD